jgi:hypothetical protein
MGILKKQALRLLRETWTGPQELAEEIFAILSSDEPIEIDSPVRITAPQGSNWPPLTVRQFGQNPATIVHQGTRGPVSLDPVSLDPANPGDEPRVERPDIDPVEYLDDLGDWDYSVQTPDGQTEEKDPDEYFYDFGGSDIGPVNINIDGRTPDALQPPLRDMEGVTAGGALTPVKIVSGSGATYVVRLYPRGPNASPAKTVTARHLTMASDARVAAGTWTWATQSGGVWYLQLPVWG